MIASTNQMQARMTEKMLSVDQFLRMRRVPPILARKVLPACHPLETVFCTLNANLCLVPLLFNPLITAHLFSSLGAQWRH